MPIDGEMCPSRSLDAKETSVTAPFPLQVMPSHAQQSVSFRHDTARPPSCESLARNWRREPFSCPVQELVGEAKEISTTRAKPREGMGNLLLYFMYGKWSGSMVFLTKLAWKPDA